MRMAGVEINLSYIVAKKDLFRNVASQMCRGVQLKISWMMLSSYSQTRKRLGEINDYAQ